MSRIADLGEACDEGIKTLKDLMKADQVADFEVQSIRMKAAAEAVHAYFKYATAPGG